MFCINSALEKIDQMDNIIICLRHAERYHDSNLRVGPEVGITMQGQTKTKLLGDYLNARFDKNPIIKTSPIKRCFETAKLLANCFKQEEVSILTSKILGDPGPYINDEKIAAEIFNHKKIFDIVQRQISGQTVPGFKSTTVGTTLMLQEMLSDLSQTSKPVLYISHDVILTTFIGSLIEDIKVYEENWIYYLEGFCFFKKGKSFYIKTAQHLVEIDKTKLPL